jgi:ABC-type lipoprotein release transport system permease subunit
MVDNSVRFYTGYIQVHQAGYWADKVIDNSFDSSPELEGQISQVNGVESVVPRLESFALSSFKNQTKGALVMGVDPVKEDGLTRISDKIVAGKYLDQNDEGVLVAQGLADYLNIQENDTLILIGQGYHGANAAGLFPVRGIVKFAIPTQNNSVIYLSLSKAQWFYAADNLLTSLSLTIDNPKNTDRIVSEIKSLVNPEVHEVMGWRELVPELVQSIELDNFSGKVMLWILYIVIGFGMFGTYLMMTMERQYEFGIMIAIGMKRIRLQSLIFLEILLMTLIGVMCGIILSLPMLTYFHFNPIHFDAESAKAIEQFGVEAVYAFSIDPVVFANQAYAIFIMALILSGYPLWSIYKMKVVESMRG